ncbi:hypothetical protein [Actinoalloteichus hymeniacidonis]|uniref:Uncharacterized protein n=1 Tax=Actinoalloteichus hymeniacidonis TaxID=340345 RepID=A0AAC9N0Y1_9PSEU|nr:hypothetical protein [Actinoalloteichus hymeniacidonis]AOS66074.1 hypothetical protein TL08_26525 [Actinoalloteichus hymeniacidonis]MBB5905822.1 hypothetical protein [Actinoalloteichus hymeniacidonis]
MLKPWMHKRPGETDREVMHRRSRTCYYCPREDTTVDESIEHEKTHERPAHKPTTPPTAD